MKRTINFSLSVVASLVMLSACDKEMDKQQSNVSLDGLAYIKVINVAPNFRQVFNAPDSFNVYLEQTKINGSFLTYNAGFPVTTSNTNTYAAVPAGLRTFRFTQTASPVSILEFQKNLDVNQKYSLLITDSIIRSSAYDNIFLKDNFAIPDTGHFNLRFVHAVLNDTAGTKVDVYSKRYATNIFSDVPVKGVVDFKTLPYTLLADTLIVRRAGTQNVLTTLNGASFSRKRVYTLVYKGTTLLAPTVAKGKNLMIYPNY